MDSIPIVDPRSVLKELIRIGSVPRGVRTSIRSSFRVLRILDMGDLPEKFGEDVALLSIGVSVAALKKALPGWRVVASEELNERWEKLPSHKKRLPFTGDSRLDVRNLLAERLVEDRVYEYARNIQKVFRGEDSLAEAEAKVPELSVPPITPKMDRKHFTHYMPLPKKPSRLIRRSGRGLRTSSPTGGSSITRGSRPVSRGALDNLYLSGAVPDGRSTIPRLCGPCRRTFRGIWT